MTRKQIIKIIISVLIAALHCPKGPSGLFFVLKERKKVFHKEKPRVINKFSFWTTFSVDKNRKTLKMSNITKSFGKLCDFFLKKTCQKICAIQKFILLLHRFFGSTIRSLCHEALI